MGFCTDKQQKSEFYVWTSLWVSLKTNWATNWKPAVSCMRKVHTQPLNWHHTNPTLISFLIGSIFCWKIADRQGYRSVHGKKLPLFLLPITRKKSPFHKLCSRYSALCHICTRSGYGQNPNEAPENLHLHFKRSPALCHLSWMHSRQACFMMITIRRRDIHINDLHRPLKIQTKWCSL